MPADQAAILAELRAVNRRLTTAVMEALPDTDRDRLLRFVAAADSTGRSVPRGFHPSSLRTLRRRDGHVGANPDPRAGHWWRHVGRADHGRERRGTGGHRPHSVSAGLRRAGGFVVSASVLDAVEREALRTTLLVFASVVIIVTLAFRHLPSIVLVLGSLFTGVALMTSVAIVTGQRVNALNFVAFPITFGIGAEYAMNVLQRLREPNGDVDTGVAIQRTGRAVALCSLTTIIGYGSLLLAQNQALFSFGVLAVLGEITAPCCGRRRAAGGGFCMDKLARLISPRVVTGFARRRPQQAPGTSGITATAASSRPRS